MKLSHIIVGLVGAAIGSGITYIVTKKTIQARCDEEIAAYKEYYDSKLEAEVEKRIDNILEKESESGHNVTTVEFECRLEPDPSIKAASVPSSNAIENYVRTRERIEYQGHMSADEARETGDPELIEAAEWLERRDKMLAEGYISGQDGSPQVISMLTYTGEGEGEYTYQSDYNHVSLDWYAGDGVLAYSMPCEIDGVEHEMNELVEKPNFVVGWKWKEHFGDPELFNDDDCVYVRNEYLKCDFEIIRDAGKYREIVLGDYSEENDDEGKS